MKRLLVGLAAVAALAGCSSSGKAADTTTSTSTSAAPTTTVPATTTTIPPPDVHKGHGDDVINIRKPAGPGATALVHLHYVGPSNFIVSTLDGAQGIANVIGDYDGYTILDRGPQRTTQLQVKSSGDWEIDIEALASAARFATSTSGAGDDVLWYDGPTAAMHLSYVGSRNFIVTAFPVSNGQANGVVNEIGSYNGTDVVPGPSLLQIEATGPWTIAPS